MLLVGCSGYPTFKFEVKLLRTLLFFSRCLVTALHLHHCVCASLATCKGSPRVPRHHFEVCARDVLSRCPRDILSHIRHNRQGLTVSHARQLPALPKTQGRKALSREVTQR